jgi:hypothetical protein
MTELTVNVCDVFGSRPEVGIRIWAIKSTPSLPLPQVDQFRGFFGKNVQKAEIDDLGPKIMA